MRSRRFAGSTFVRSLSTYFRPASESNTYAVGSENGTPGFVPSANARATHTNSAVRLAWPFFMLAHDEPTALAPQASGGRLVIASNPALPIEKKIPPPPV